MERKPPLQANPIADDERAGRQRKRLINLESLASRQAKHNLQNSIELNLACVTVRVLSSFLPFVLGDGDRRVEPDPKPP